jgi:DNA repair protein RadC
MDIKLTEAEKIKILNSDDLYGIMQRILLRENKINQDREHFWVIGLSNSNRLLFIELISKGTINKTLVEPMEVFSFALQKRAVKIMLVHNHPSGELKPSDADKDITDRLIQVGIIVNTEVLDHLIISNKSYLSFTDIGLLKELKKSTRWVPEYEIKEQIRKQATEIAKEKAYLEKMKIVKSLKEKGVDFETISEATGVSITEIEKIKVRKK